MLFETVIVRNKSTSKSRLIHLHTATDLYLAHYGCARCATASSASGPHAACLPDFAALCWRRGRINIMTRVCCFTLVDMSRALKGRACSERKAARARCTADQHGQPLVSPRAYTVPMMLTCCAGLPCAGLQARCKYAARCRGPLVPTPTHQQWLVCWL